MHSHSHQFDKTPMEQSEPSARPLLSTRGTGPSEQAERTNQAELLPVGSVELNAAQKPGDVERMKNSKSTT